MADKYKGDDVDLLKLLPTADEQLMWQFVDMAHFLNMSYEDVKALPFDEFNLLQRIKQIKDYTKTKTGVEILKDNIRYTATNPNMDKLHERFGGD
ncbi:MAG: hypothetical protein AB9856_20885 [Cellulosilyticaceae bacterium]